jgi:hypothetical protein
MPAVTAAKLLREVERMPPPQVGRTGLRARLRAQAMDLALDEQLIAPRRGHTVVPLESVTAAELRCGGERFLAPWLLPASGELTALGVVACTIGPALEARVRSLFTERRASLALALDSLGNEALSALSRRVEDDLLAEVTRSGLAVAGELRPGDPGLAIEAQGGVVRLAGAADLGMTVTRLNMLNPTKSATAIFGVGRNLPAARWSRCDTCRSRKGCRMARRGSEAGESA